MKHNFCLLLLMLSPYLREIQFNVGNVLASARDSGSMPADLRQFPKYPPIETDESRVGKDAHNRRTRTNPTYPRLPVIKIFIDASRLRFERH